MALKICACPPLKAQGSLLKMRQKDFRTRGDDTWETVSPRHSRTDTHLTSQILWQYIKAYTDSNQMETWTQGPIPNQPRIYLQLIPVVKGKIRFLRWSLMGILNHTSGWASCSRVVGQHKLNGSCAVFLSHFAFGTFCVYVSFYLLFSEENKIEEERGER